MIRWIINFITTATSTKKVPISVVVAAGVAAAGYKVGEHVDSNLYPTDCENDYGFQQNIVVVTLTRRNFTNFVSSLFISFESCLVVIATSVAAAGDDAIIAIAIAVVPADVVRRHGRTG